MSTLQR